MPTLTTKDGTSLHYRDWGSGRPVLLLHGWALGGEMWEYQTTWLVSQGLRAITLDARGCGRSDDPGHGYDLDTLAADLAALLGHLDLEQVTLVAHSMAAGIAARLLSRHGDARIARLLLLAPGSPHPVDAAGRAAFDFLRAELARDRPAFLAAGAAGFFGASEVSPQIVAWMTGLALSASPRATMEYVRTMSESDTAGDLRAIRIPALVIHGDRDTSTSFDLGGRRSAELIPGARFVAYEGAAHGLFYTEMARFHEDLLAFVNGGTAEGRRQRAGESPTDTFTARAACRPGRASR